MNIFASAGLFDANNVVVSNGTMQLWARPAKRNASWPVAPPFPKNCKIWI